MNVLITGGAGFIGSHLSEKLIASGYRVICFDDFSGLTTSYDYKWKNICGIIGDTQRYRIISGDIRERGYLEIPFKQEDIDVVIHLAAKTGVRPSVQDPILHCKVNVTGTVNLLQLCVQHDIKRLIFASSSSIYGANSKLPFSEEDKADSQLSPYAATKKAGENISYVYHEIYGLNVVCLRLFTVYGPRQRKEMAISSFTKKILKNEEIIIFGNGENSRDYTYIDDVITGFINALSRFNNGYEIYNIGCGSSVSLNRLISLIEAKLGKKAIINYESMQPGEVNHTCADISKASQVLLYSPKISIENGIDKYIDWYINEELQDK